MSDTWFAEIEGRVFTIIKTRMKKKYKERYPTIDFVSTGENRTPSVSPTVYLREIDSPEMANTLENNVIDMVRENIECEVYSLNREDAHTVSALLRVEMKALGFSIIQQSPPMTDGSWWRSVMRFSRPIWSGDVVK